MSRGEPPSDLARLEIFYSLVGEYDALAAAFPIENESTFVAGSNHQRDPKDKWHRIVRIMTLRKFTIAKGDHVYVTRATDSIRAVATSPEWADHLEPILATWVSAVEDIGTSMLYNDRSGFDVVEDLAYGLYMHGDYDRWQRVRSLPDLLIEQPLWQLAVESEILIRDIRQALDQMIENGAIPSFARRPGEHQGGTIKRADRTTR